MRLNPTSEQLARLRTLVARVNAGRRVRTLRLEAVLEAAHEALGSRLGYAWRHGGAHDDARASTTLCLAVQASGGLTVGLAGTRAPDPDPGKGWAELRPWSQRLAAQNASRCAAWGERAGDDRLSLGVEAERPRRGASTGDVLLVAVLAAPAEDALRLVYGDWLTEQGDPRGELIVVQCARASLSPSDPSQPRLKEREAALLSLHEEPWRAVFGPGVLSVKFQRGFVEEATLYASSLIDGAEALFSREPLRSARVVDAGVEGALQLGASPALRRLSQLRLSSSSAGHGIGPEGLGGLLGSRHLGALQTLCLEGQQLGDLGASLLARAGPAALPSLRALQLSEDTLSAVGVAALGATRWFRRLRRVCFSGNALRETGVEALAFAPGAAAWEELELDGNLVGDAGARLLAGHARLGSLTRLSLQRTHLGPAGVQALLDSPKLRGLKALRLDGNRIGGLLVDKVKTRFEAW